MPTSTRKHERYRVHATVNAKCGTWGEFLEVYARNISYGGLFVCTDELPEIGTTIELRIQTPDEKVFSVSGCVAHIIDPRQAAINGLPIGFGVEFLEVTAEQAKALGKLIAIAKRHVAAPPPPRSE